MEFFHQFYIHAIYGAVVAFLLGRFWYAVRREQDIGAERTRSNRRISTAIILSFLLTYGTAVVYNYMFLHTGIRPPYLFALLAWLLFLLPFVRVAKLTKMPQQTIVTHVGYSLILFAVLVLMTQIIRVLR